MNNMCVDDYLKTTDYKSIALPAELQGLLSIKTIFRSKDQLNQRINIIASLRK